MKRFHVAAILLLLILVFVNRSLAFNDRITYLGIEQGLSNNSVKCIFKDHNGFMWFGTYDGLNRYDGYGLKVFRNNLGDSNSLPHNYIYTLNEDRHNNLWVGTGQGIGIYNNLTLKFLPAYYLPYKSNKKEKISFHVNSIQTNAKGDVFVGSNGFGLFVQFDGRDISTQVPLNINGRETIYYNVQAITIDKDQLVWLLIRSVGLCLFNTKTSSIQLVNNTIKSAACLATDEERIWLGTTSGLYEYSKTLKSIVKNYNAESGMLSSNNVATLSFDKQARLWIGTEGGGINILNPATSKIDYLSPGENNNAITSESVSAIYPDKESRIWIGTLKGGINIIDSFKNQFQTISHIASNKNSLVNNFASSFFEDADNNLWIGTDGGGLSIWNRKENRFASLFHSMDNALSLSKNSVTCIKQDHLNNIWISTFGGGVNKYNKSTGTFEHFRCINNITGEENEDVWLIFEDSQKTLWASTFGNGKLYRFNRALNAFEMFDQKFNDFIAITEDKKGFMWGGNSHQLIRIDRSNKMDRVYEMGKPVRSIYEDKAGNFWVGLEGGGLILFDTNKGIIISRFSTAEGLCNNAVLNILEDSKGNLWLSTFNGLSRFSPVDKSFKNYYQDDGLQSNQFLYNGALKLKSGELVFGGIKGFNIFYPDSILAHHNIPPIVLTGLRVNNIPVTIDDEFVTEINNDQVQALRIPFNQAVLSFDFAALEFSSAGKILYAFYLQGWDKGWNYTGNVRTANYTRLVEGDYVLRIKSTNAEGIWNTKEIAVNIKVLPPWYRSWWAYTFYVLISGAAIYLFLQYRSRQSKLEYEVAIAKLNAEKERAELEKERSKREKTQAEYEREKAEHETERVINERDREINEKKLSFFTDVSHEFRTPLTLIINPVKDLLNKNQGAVDNKELNIVYRNARRLLSLVDQLLLFRKADTQADVLSISRINFSIMCQEVYLSFVQQAKAKRIIYDFECANNNLEIWVDKEKIEIALFNLISNALKYTSEGGRVVFKISENDNEVEVAVIDNGPGIPKEVGNKLFDKYYRVPVKGGSSKIGFGIGLFLVKHFVESHHGVIYYESDPGNRTSFVMKLPKEVNAPPGNQGSEPVNGGSVMYQEMIEEPVSKEDKTQLEDMVRDRQSILIVDDDMQLRQYIAGLFQDNFFIYEADNAEEGLKIAHKNTPDIIITDITMSGMSGIDFCKDIKSSPELGYIPVILLTGTSSTETKLKGLEYGADDYITKPFEKELFVARVHSILKSRNVLQNYFYNEVTLQKNSLKVTAEYKEFLDKCIKIVEAHLDDRQFSIQILASELGMSHSALYKKVKLISRQSVTGFIKFIRLRKAAQLLITTDCNVNEAAFQVGFNDIKYFRSQFNKLFGVNPSEYIKKFRRTFNKNLTLSDKAVGLGKK